LPLDAFPPASGIPIVSFPDYLVDRRLLQRKVSFWRLMAFIVMGVAIVALGAKAFSGFRSPHAGPHIARLAIEGLITGDSDTLKLIDDIAKSRAAGVLITIESPGGTTTGSEKVYDALRALAAKKPVVAVVGTMAASGAYIAALGTDQIFARGNSLVGSIGVLFEFPNFAGLLDKIGVQVETVKSAPLKASPNGFEPTSPQARAALAALVADSFDWFKGLVRDRRKLDDAGLATVSDGRVFTGRQAIGLHLIDRLGGENDAVAWMESERGVSKGLKIEDWKASRSLERLGLVRISSSIARQFGLTSVAQAIEQARTALDIRQFDGLVSVWQADLQ
jgi:protease-4